MSEKQLQRFILARIELALDGRTWAWLARTSRTPKSTLATQAAISRFSIEVLTKVSRALKREIGWFFPDTHRRRVPARTVRRLTGWYAAAFAGGIEVKRDDEDDGVGSGSHNRDPLQIPFYILNKAK